MIIAIVGIVISNFIISITIFVIVVIVIILFIIITIDATVNVLMTDMMIILRLFVWDR